jgi:hypothetical protein
VCVCVCARPLRRRHSRRSCAAAAPTFRRPAPPPLHRALAQTLSQMRARGVCWSSASNHNSGIGCVAERTLELPSVCPLCGRVSGCVCVLKRERERGREGVCVKVQIRMRKRDLERAACTSSSPPLSLPPSSLLSPSSPRDMSISLHPSPPLSCPPAFLRLHMHLSCHALPYCTRAMPTFGVRGSGSGFRVPGSEVLISGTCSAMLCVVDCKKDEFHLAQVPQVLPKVVLGVGLR